MRTDNARTEIVDSAREAWIRRLIPTTRNNNLLYFRELQTGTLNLAEADSEALSELFRGEKLVLSRLVPPGYDPRAGAKLREIVRKAQSNLEEKGLQTLFVAYGMATWTIDDGGRPPEAAVVLLPITVEGKRTDSDSLRLFAEGAPQANIALLHALAEDHELEISEEELLDSDEPGEFDPDTVLEHLHLRANHIKGFQIQKRAVIGNFSFQKLSMVRDLKECVKELTEHEIVAALAGDQFCRASLGRNRVSVDLTSLDSMPPESEFMVLDADSSQQAAVHAVATSSSGVIQGPPGCGKSQTIANIITTLIAQGQRVLFVAEKRAALEAVYKRLDAEGLGHLALDLHGAGISQKAVMQKVSATLGQIRHSSVPDDVELNGKFVDRRKRVVMHSDLMHSPIHPAGLTPYELQACLLETELVITSRTRWRGIDLTTLNAENVSKITDLLAEAKGHAELILRRHSSPWTEANLQDGQAAQDALDAAIRLSQEHLPGFKTHLEALAASAGFPTPITLNEANEVLKLTREVNTFLDEWNSAIFQELNLLADLAPSDRGPITVVWATLTNARYRAGTKRVSNLCQKSDLSAKSKLEAVRLAKALVDRWSSLSVASGKFPERISLTNAAYESLNRVGYDLATLGKAFPSFEDQPIEQLTQKSAALACDDATPHLIPTVRRIESDLMVLGAGALSAEIRQRALPAQHWPTLFRHAYFASCYDAARIANPSLAAFQGESHGAFVNEFRILDRERLQVASDRVRREHATKAIQTMDANPEQTDLVRAESMKRSRHLPLRKLVTRAADVLTAVCPCWMSSPLNVSQLLPAGKQYFDVVVFDEASQVLPEDAICSILRGSRLVVAGDRHQLPPSSFFADGGGDEDEDAPTSGYESLLDQMSAFVEPWSLEWHYRSRDERLIAFSNRHIYDDSLTTFPGIAAADCVSHVLVESMPRDGEEESNSAEVLEVVRLIIEHAQLQLETPVGSDRESLGVITLGIKHANRVQAALDKALESKRHLADFLDTSNDNPWFFLKNLERVQGDERDAIILSVGYAKDRNGKLPYRFGPLLQQGGERRLNVAISRARRRMTVVSSFSHVDMDPRRSDKKGVELLRLFLQFAASGGRNLGDTGASGISLNAFEADIRDALANRGIPLTPQYGASGYRLDFAAMHPDRPGEFVLAIECDGATYHSAPTARDRDRLRQQQLEAIGWRFHRIWSTDWFLRREAEINRTVSAWEDAVKESDRRRAALPNGNVHLGGLFGDNNDLEQVTIEPRNSVSISPIAPSAPRRMPEAPPVDARGNITFYYDNELDDLVRWVISDGLLRTTDEVINEVIPLLGLKRRGTSIVSRLQDSIGRVTARNAS